MNIKFNNMPKKKERKWYIGKEATQPRMEVGKN